MKRFEFKLQPLLKYRQYQEQIARQKSARAQMDVKTCEEQLVQLQQTYDRHADEIETIVAKGVSAAELRWHHQYLAFVENSIHDEKLKKIELKRIFKEKLLELKKKSIDKEAMEIYRGKLKGQYIQETLKIEEKELDEISSLKTARKVSNETV